MHYSFTPCVPLAEVRSCNGQVWGVEGWVDGIVQLTRAVVSSQSQVAAGVEVDTPLPRLPAVLCLVWAEGFFHLFIPISAVAVAVLSAGVFEQQPLQGVLHADSTRLALCPRRRGRPVQAPARLCLGLRLLPR